MVASSRGKETKLDDISLSLCVARLSLSLNRPRSAGYIRLRSADPYDKPLIYPNYFVDDQDVRVLVEGVKIGLALGETASFKKLGTKFWAQPFPGCEHLPLWTDPYWACFVRHYSSTIYHPTGTAKMGPPGDPTAVVDPQLRVYGIHNLRVIDCSIMPNVPSGNTNAPAVSFRSIYFDSIYF